MTDLRVPKNLHLPQQVPKVGQSGWVVRHPLSDLAKSGQVSDLRPDFWMPTGLADSEAFVPKWYAWGLIGGWGED